MFAIFSCFPKFSRKPYFVKALLMKSKNNRISICIFLAVCFAFFFCSLHTDKVNKNRSPASTTFYKTTTTSSIEIRSRKLNARKTLWTEVVQELENQKKTKNLPKIIGIGMEDCGIDDLISLLHPHPSIRVHFKPESKSFGSLNDAHIEKYLDTLPLVEKKAYLFEKKSLGFHLPPYNIPYFIKKLFTTVKLFLVVCEPAQRAHDNFYKEKFERYQERAVASMSDFKSFTDYLRVYMPFVKQEIGDYSNNWKETEIENKLFDLLKLQKNHRLTSILTTSLYALHLQRWLSHFDETNLMVIDRQELYDDPGLLIERVQEFASLPKLLLKDDFQFDSDSNSWCFDNKDFSRNTTCFNRNNNTSVGSTDSNRTLHDLKLFYKSHNKKLFEILGKNFNW